MLKIRLFFFVVLVLSLSSCNQKNCSTNCLTQSLHFSALAQTWDEAVPLGNGELGALVWQKDNKLRFSLDRSDLWDLRPIESFRKEGFSYEWVTGQVKNRDYKPVQDLFDVPYNQLPAPSKIPGAALEFDMHRFGNVEKVELDIANAICNVEWKSGVKMLTFVCADKPVGWFRFENIPEGFTPDLVPPVYEKSDTGLVENELSGQDLQRLGYKQCRVKTNENSVIYRQKGWGNFEYEVAVAWKYQTGNALIGCWSVSSTFSENETGKNAGQMISEMLNNGFSKYFVMHQNWWTDFWRKSSIEIPDSVLQLQWYLEQYKFGSAARHNTPPISLQAVWTADNGKLPPWKGDFHHDLNTQLSYWPAYSGNHLDLELGFINWLWNNRETFKDYTRNYFNTEGLNVP